jgi:hypothetical protein
LDDASEHGGGEVGQGFRGQFGLFGIEMRGEGLEEVVVFGEQFGGTGNGEHGVALKHVAEGGQEGVPDAVASEVGGGVGGILVKRKVFAANDFSEVVFSEMKEWTEDLEGVAAEGEVGHGTHGGEAARTGSSEESEEKRLGLVVRVVGERDVGCATFESGFAEESESLTASGGFQGFVVPACAVGDIDGAGDERNLARRAEGAKGGLIGFPFGDGAESVVEVGGDEGVGNAGVEEVEESGGVESTGDAHEDGSARVGGDCGGVGRRSVRIYRAGRVHRGGRRRGS